MRRVRGPRPTREAPGLDLDQFDRLAIFCLIAFRSRLPMWPDQGRLAHFARKVQVREAEAAFRRP
jgi:hypothetical protein